MSNFFHFRSAFRSIFLFILFFSLLQDDLSSQPRFFENGELLNHGSDCGSFLDTPTRIKLDLSGRWNYQVEGGSSGTIRVPCAYGFTGTVVFDRTFEVTAAQIETYQFQLVMLGVNHSCEVSINGEFLTNHSGGYTTIQQAIPKNLIQVGKENTIRVVVNNELDPRKTLPLRPLAWGVQNYGGILRDVFLLGTPPLSIRDAIVQTDLEGTKSATVSVKATVEGRHPGFESVPFPSTPGESRVFFFEMVEKYSGTPIGRSRLVSLTRQGDEWGGAEAELTVKNPKLWTPEYPDLYLLKCYVARVVSKEVTVEDEYDVDCGLRTIEVSGGHLTLNDRRLLLKGVVWYEEHPTFGSALTREEMEKDVVLIKSLGANAIRIADHPPHPYMLNLCDRYGLLVLEELPLENTPAVVLSTDAYLDLASTMAREMVGRDRTHPSVVAWGVGNEIEASTPAARSFVEGLVHLIRSMDSRPIYIGSRMLQDDICNEVVDIVAANDYGADVKVFKTQLDDWRTAYRSKPLLIGRFGTEVQHDNRNGYSDPLSQEAQARFFMQRFDVMKTADEDGMFIWAFNDWRGARPSLTIRTGDPWMHSMGLVNEQGEKRLAFDAVRASFRGEKFVALPVGTHTSHGPIMYVLAGFVVLIGTAYVYNASRRFRDNVKRALFNSYNFFADVRDQHVVSTGHTILLGVVIAIASGIVISSILLHYRGSWLMDNLLSYLLISDELKAAAVRIIWNPVECMAWSSALVFVGLTLLAGAVHMLKLFTRTRIFAFHAFTVTIWSAAPLLALVPIGMILFRVMESSTYVFPSLILIGVICLWVLIRLFKGISIIFDASPLRIYLMGIVAVVAVLACVFFYFDYTQSTSLYIAYMYHVMTSP